MAKIGHVDATFKAGRKETKNKIVFDEVVEDGDWPVIGTLYVSKPIVKQLGDPTELQVRIVGGSHKPW